MSDPAKAVFLSYASQDAEAARRIAEALRAAGIEVWFDQAELVGGDAWDAKIRKQIAECALFVPVISATTQARREGYFRLEWRIAAQRTHMIADGTPFLLPIVIDGTRDAEALVPAEFKGVQWTRLREGETPAAFCARVAKLLAGAPEPAPTPGGFSPPASVARPSSKAKWMALAAAAVVFALWITHQLGEAKRSENPSAGAPALPAVAANPGPLSRVLELRALNGLTRERLAAAEDLLAQTLKVDPTSAGALALAAQVDALMVYRSWDLSDERRQAATKRSARAVALAPDEFESRRAQALVAGFMVRTPASLQEAESLYRALAAERAGDANVLEELGTVLHHQRKFDEAAQVFTQAGRPPLVGAALHAAGRSAEARRIADELLAQRRTAAALILKANVELFAYNNRAAAQAAVNQLTPTELREDDAAGIALRLAVLSRDAEGLLRLLESFPHPFVSILGVNYPRQYWTGLARSWQSQPEAAEIEWRGGLRSLEERLAAKPSDADALSWLAMFHSCLGQRAEMERALRTYGNYRDLSAGLWDWNYCLPLLRFGERKEEVLARLSRSLRDTANFNRILYAWARYSPEFDPIRGDPQFERLLRETRPQTAVPYDDEVVAPATRADEKSVAVLAFANLSDDKANEYFSDGISEELLNVLAKVPGLKISARTSAFFFKGKNTPIPEIAKQLGVAYVVEGSVRRSGDRVRITAQLIKAADGFHMWSETFTRDLKDIFAVQDEIAGLIAQNLQVKMSGAAVATGSGASENYDLILQARHMARQESNEGWRRAIALYRDALKTAPNAAAAWAGIADAYVQLARFNGMPALPGMNEARAAARRALELAPDDPVALTAMGWVARTADWNWPEARRYFARALEVQPGSAATLSASAILELNLGQKQEALQLARRAVAADPLNPSAQFTLGVIEYNRGAANLALPLYQRAIALAPTAEEYHCHLAVILALLGRHEEALREIEKEPNEGYRLVAVAHCAALRGDLTTGRAARDALIARHADDFPGYISDVCASLGDTDGALEWFERSIARRDNSVPWFGSSVWQEPLRANPRWQELIRRVGLAEGPKS